MVEPGLIYVVFLELGPQIHTFNESPLHTVLSSQQPLNSFS
jgi:hypothetical protein